MFFFLCIFGGLCCEILKFCADDTKANTYITGKAFYLNTRNALICRKPDDIYRYIYCWCLALMGRNVNVLLMRYLGDMIWMETANHSLSKRSLFHHKMIKTRLKYRKTNNNTNNHTGNCGTGTSNHWPLAGNYSTLAFSSSKLKTIKTIYPPLFIMLESLLEYFTEW